MKIQAHHILDEREKEFCLMYMAAGDTIEMVGKAYRRAFYPPIEDDVSGLFEPAPNTPEDAEAEAAGLLLLEDVGIQSWLDTMRRTATETAVDVLSEQILTGSSKEKINAAKQIFELENRLETRDATELHTSIMCAIGVEIVVDLPGGGEVVVPMRDVFPKYADAKPPEWVTDKTNDALIARIRVLEGEVADYRENDGHAPL